MIYKRLKSKNYYMDFMVQGQRVNRSTKTANKEIAVKVEQAEKDRTLELMFTPQPDTMSVKLSDYIEEVFADKWATQASGEQTYDRLQVCLDFLGNVDISTINRRTLKTLRKHLTNGRGVATVNRYMAHLKTLLNEARKDELIENVPHFDMKPEPKTRDIFYTLSALDEKKLLDFCSKGKGLVKDMADLIVLGLETGMRLGEMIGLRVSQNVDFKRNEIRLYADMTKTGNHRIVPMSPKVSALLKKRQQLCTNGRLFDYQKTSVCHAWKLMKERSKVGGNTSPHSLRHTFATRALSGGMNIKHVQALLGHTSVKTTERYAHVINDDLHEAIRQLSGVSGKKELN